MRRPVIIAAAVIVTALGIGTAAAVAASNPGTNPSAAKAAGAHAELDRIAKLPKRQKPAQQQGLAEAAAHKPDPGNDDTLTEGIIDTRQGPFPGTAFTVRNMYRGLVDGRWVFVFAGAERGQQGDITGGALRVFQQQAGAYSEIGVFKAPAVASALTITSYHAQRLTLTADNGVTITFDLSSMRYGS